LKHTVKVLLRPMDSSVYWHLFSPDDLKSSDTWYRCTYLLLT